MQRDFDRSLPVDRASVCATMLIRGVGCDSSAHSWQCLVSGEIYPLSHRAAGVNFRQGERRSEWRVDCDDAAVRNRARLGVIQYQTLESALTRHDAATDVSAPAHRSRI